MYRSAARTIPRGPGDTESRRRIFVCRPQAGQPEDPCARRILHNAGAPGLSRPVTAADTRSADEAFRGRPRATAAASTPASRWRLSAILVSPDFLFRIEKSPAGSAPGNASIKFGDLDLASRLSFFLWSSIPDEELLALAEQGKLHDPAVLTAQVKRMLADPKSEGAGGEFRRAVAAPAQCCRLEARSGQVQGVRRNLRNAFERETELFFDKHRARRPQRAGFHRRRLYFPE